MSPLSLTICNPSEDAVAWENIAKLRIIHCYFFQAAGPASSSSSSTDRLSRKPSPTRAVTSTRAPPSDARVAMVTASHYAAWCDAAAADYVMWCDVMWCCNSTTRHYDKKKKSLVDNENQLHCKREHLKPLKPETSNRLLFCWNTATGHLLSITQN